MSLKKTKKYLSLFLVLMLVFVQVVFIFDIPNIAKAQEFNDGGQFLSPPYQTNNVSFDDVLVIKYQISIYEDFEIYPVTFAIHTYGELVEASGRIGLPVAGSIAAFDDDMVYWRAEIDLSSYNLDKNLTYDIKADVYHKTLYLDDSFVHISINDNSDNDWMEDEQSDLDDLILKIHNKEGSILKDGDFVLGSASEELMRDYYFIFENKSKETYKMFWPLLVDWAELEEYGIYEADNLDTPYAYKYMFRKSNFEEDIDIDYYVFFVQNIYENDANRRIESNKVSVMVQESIDAQSDPYAINIYSDDDIHSNSHILASFGSNFTIRALPKLFFKHIPTNKMQPPVSMINFSCDSMKFLSDEIRRIFEDSGHGLCFRALVPTQASDKYFQDGKYFFWVEVEEEVPTSNLEDFQLRVFKSDIKSTKITFYDKSTSGGKIMDGHGNEYVSHENNTSSDSLTSLSFNKEADCLELGLYDDLKCKKFKALISGQLDHYCIDSNIYEIEACEEYLRLKQVGLECQKEDISNIEECKDFMLEKYIDTVECAIDDDVLCRSILRDKYLNRLVVAKERQAKIASTTRSIFGQTLSLDELKVKMQENKIETDILPLLADKEINVFILKSSESTVLESTEQLTIRNNMIIVLDNDKDGLSDDAEKYYGTDPQKIDSDDDGFSDLEEIKNGYNPTGDGLFNQFMSNLDIVMTTGHELEQPQGLTLDTQDEELSLNLLLNDSNSKNIKLSGTAKPNTWVNIFLYSDLPLVMTAKADASGNWTYDLQNSLVDGSHKVYVTVNDDTGNIVKQSNPLAFLVKSAQAVTADQYFQTEDNIMGAEYSMLWTYISGAIFLIIFGLVFIFILHHQSKKEI